MPDLLSAPHFDAIAERYARSPSTLKPLYEAARGELDLLIAGRDLLDIGNGGIFPYDRTRAASITVLDLSAAMLARLPSGVARIQGDARRMGACADASFDAVLFNLSFHHISADSPAELASGRRAALAEAWRVLRPGGDLLVYEPVLRPGLAALQRGAFGLTRRALALFGAPMVFFETRDSLVAQLAAVCGVGRDAVVVASARASGWADPLGGTFPGLVRLPVAAFPTRFELFRLGKPRG